MRAADFAFFLLTALDKPAYRTSALIGQPFDLYMELFRKDKDDLVYDPDEVGHDKWFINQN